MTLDLDRELIGRTVEMLMRRDPAIGTWPQLDRASGVSRATLHRVLAGQPNVTAGTFQRIEAALGLPTDTLHTIGMHRVDDLAQMGVDAQTVAWVRRQITAR